jgi:hypothetical protein
MSDQGFPFSRQLIKNLRTAKYVKFNDNIAANALREVQMGLNNLIKSITTDNENLKGTDDKITDHMPDLCILGFMAGFMYYHDNFKRSANKEE